ncbi:MAG: hypothetical protein V7L28_24425 [Nostoc sp.]
MTVSGRTTGKTISSFIEHGNGRIGTGEAFAINILSLPYSPIASSRVANLLSRISWTFM